MIKTVLIIVCTVNKTVHTEAVVSLHFERILDFIVVQYLSHYI